MIRYTWNRMLKCPRCGATHVLRSPRRRFERAAKFLLPGTLYACRNCGARIRVIGEDTRKRTYLFGGILLLMIAIAAVTYVHLGNPKDRLPPPPPSPSPTTGAAPAENRPATPESKTAETDRSKQAEPSPKHLASSSPASTLKTPSEESRAAMPPDSSSPGSSSGPSSDSSAVSDPPPKPESSEPAASRSNPTTPDRLPEKNTIAALPSNKTPAAGSAHTLKTVRIAHNKEKTMLSATVVFGAPVSVYRWRFTGDPSRLIVDLPGQWAHGRKTVWSLPGKIARRLRIGKHPDKLRLVFDLATGRRLVPLFVKTQEGLTIRLRPEVGGGNE